jgi:hypothetical protein
MFPSRCPNSICDGYYWPTIQNPFLKAKKIKKKACLIINIKGVNSIVRGIKLYVYRVKNFRTG